MGWQLWKLFVASVIFTVANMRVCGEPQVPCYFVFGDSLFDNGNNNNLAAMFKANYPPYGVDYPAGTTGRFSNGRNIADILAELVGFQHHVPPFADAPKGREILEGVNYASGGSGVLDDPGQTLGSGISLEGQLKNHVKTISDISIFFGFDDFTYQYLQKCLYTVGIGSSDYLNYYLAFNKTQEYISPDQFANVLTVRYVRQLRRMHQYGARKIALFGIHPLGCIPRLANRTSGVKFSCNADINNAVEIFNRKLKSAIEFLKEKCPNSTFVYVNAYGILSRDPYTEGPYVSEVPCCESSISQGTGLCNPQGYICTGRETYKYFDAIHPSDATALIIARRAYSAELPTDTYPVDIRTLLQDT